MNDKIIVNNILEGSEKRTEALKYLYENLEIRSLALRDLLSLGGTADDLEDILTDAIMVFYLNVQHGKFDSQTSVKTYIGSIIKHKYISKIRKERNIVVHALQQELYEVSDFEKQEIKKLLDLVLSKLGDKCKKLLQLWALGFSLDEIAKELGYKDAQTAKLATHDCRKKLSHFLRDHPTILSELRDIR